MKVLVIDELINEKVIKEIEDETTLLLIYDDFKLEHEFSKLYDLEINLKNSFFNKIICSGTRAKDLLLILKLNEYNFKVIINYNYRKIINNINKSKEKIMICCSSNIYEEINNYILK